MRSIRLTAFFALVLLSNSALAAYGSFCGEDVKTGVQVCYQYSPTRSLVVTGKAGEVVYPISGAIPRMEYTSEGQRDFYAFTGSESTGFLMIETRVTEPARYPGDGESELVRIDVLTPDGHRYSVTEFAP